MAVGASPCRPASSHHKHGAHGGPRPWPRLTTASSVEVITRKGACPPCARPDPHRLPAQRSQRRRSGPCLHGAPGRPPGRKPDSGHADTISITTWARRVGRNAMKPRIQCVRTPWIRGSSAPDVRRATSDVRRPMSGARARRPASGPHLASCPPHRGSRASVPHSADYIPQISKTIISAREDRNAVQASRNLPYVPIAPEPGHVTPGWL